MASPSEPAVAEGAAWVASCSPLPSAAHEHDFHLLVMCCLLTSCIACSGRPHALQAAMQPCSHAAMRGSRLARLALPTCVLAIFPTLAGERPRPMWPPSRSFLWLRSVPWAMRVRNCAGNQEYPPRLAESPCASPSSLAICSWAASGEHPSIYYLYRNLSKCDEDAVQIQLRRATSVPMDVCSISRDRRRPHHPQSPRRHAANNHAKQS